MTRFLIFFSSHPEPPADVTFVDVRARSPLEAIAKAKREGKVPHGWSLAVAYAWPMGCVDVDAAARKLTGSG